MLLRSIYGYLRMVVCLGHNLYCIPGYLILNLLLYPLFCLSVDTFSAVESTFYYWLLYVVGSWSNKCGLVVHEHGDDIYQLRKGEDIDQ